MNKPIPMNVYLYTQISDYLSAKKICSKHEFGTIIDKLNDGPEKGTLIYLMEDKWYENLLDKTELYLIDDILREFQTQNLKMIFN